MNCLLKRFVQGKIEGRMRVTGRRGRRRKKLLDDLNEKVKILEIEKETLDCILWRTGFVKAYRPLV